MEYEDGLKFVVMKTDGKTKKEIKILKPYESSQLAVDVTKGEELWVAYISDFWKLPMMMHYRTIILPHDDKNYDINITALPTFTFKRTAECTITPTTDPAPEEKEKSVNNDSGLEKQEAPEQKMETSEPIGVKEKKSDVEKEKTGLENKKTVIGDLGSEKHEDHNMEYKQGIVKIVDSVNRSLKSNKVLRKHEKEVWLKNYALVKKYYDENWNVEVLCQKEEGKITVCFIRSALEHLKKEAASENPDKKFVEFSKNLVQYYQHHMLNPSSI